MLERIFQDRDKWKKDTFNLIKNNLLSVKDNRFVQYGQTSTTHLVCLYGKAQVGKTTLILNMIGLKEECKKKVSEVLRGGVKRGNSSTSTAIIYSQNTSEDQTNKYGIKIETIDGQCITQDFEYYTPNEMLDKLQSIRDQVEMNEFSNKAILHISIPKDYFIESVSKDKISILDLPGVESRNTRERAHVESLMTRYIPISSVCIITCPANSIQSLEYEELPSNIIDWKKNTHKYLVVLTRSYSTGTIKKYFHKPREQRTIGFHEHVQDTYKRDLLKILGTNNNTEVFPLDIGDSFETLFTNELHDEEDRNEILHTRDSIISSLQESIVKHKGEQLLSTIKELHFIVDRSDKEKIRELESAIEQCKEKIKYNNRKLQKDKEKRDNDNKEHQSISNKKSELNDLDKRIEGDITKDAVSLSKNIVDALRMCISDNHLSKVKKGIEYFYDRDKSCLKTISYCLANELIKSIVSKTISLMTDCELSVDLYDSSIVNAIYSKYVNRYEMKLYPPPSGIIDRLLGSNCNVPLYDAYNYIQHIEGIIQSEIQSSVIKPCKDIINKEQIELTRDLSICNSRIEKAKRRIKSFEEDNKNRNSEIAEKEIEIETVRKQKECDEQTLNKYLKYAEKAYLSQRSDVIKKINSDITQDEKFLYVLFLGVLDRDYKSLINASN